MWTPAPAAVIPPNTYDWGYCHELIRYRDTRWSVVVLTNLDEATADPETIAQQVGTMFGATA